MTTLLVNIKGKIITLILNFNTNEKDDVIDSNFYELDLNIPRPDNSKDLKDPPNKAKSIYDLCLKRPGAIKFGFRFIITFQFFVIFKKTSNVLLLALHYVYKNLKKRCTYYNKRKKISDLKT
ncbi:hypothetical protein CDIK_3293 [Cucumispora dikerogammari]|nr:hypothetical protein CDIK_3293 [Cucumispora dikerogammari]